MISTTVLGPDKSNLRYRTNSKLRFEKVVVPQCGQHPNKKPSATHISPRYRRVLLLGGLASFGGVPFGEANASELGTDAENFWENLDLSVLPQYPGYVTLNSGLQVREDRVGIESATAAACGDILKVRWRAWTVHQGRSLGPWQTCTFTLNCNAAQRNSTSQPSTSSTAEDSTTASSSSSSWSSLSGDGSSTAEEDTGRRCEMVNVIPAWHEGLVGIRPGGVRRLLVPPLPSLSFPYVPLDATTADPTRVTKLGMAPVMPLEVGVQSLEAGEGPVPEDPRGRAFLESVVTANAFTIKLPDRAILWEVERLQPDGSRAPWLRSRGPTESSMGIKGPLMPPNPPGIDGGASWWTLTLPPQGDYD